MHLTADNLLFLLLSQAAYDLLELDPFRTSVGRVGVVISHEVAYQLHLNPSQPVRYFMWNSTAAAYPNKTITSGKLKEKERDMLGNLMLKNIMSFVVL